MGEGETYSRPFISLSRRMLRIPDFSDKMHSSQPLCHLRARVPVASLSFDCFDGDHADGSSTLESRPHFDLSFILFFSPKKEGEKNAMLVKASDVSFSLLSFSLLNLLVRAFFTIRG